MLKITVALIGAGQRGMDCYGKYALKFPHEVQFVAVAEPVHARREKFKEMHHLREDMCFADWHDLLARPRLADAILICTLDKLHFEPAMAALKAGYHILLEKPMSPSAAECVQIGAAAEQSESIFLVSHVLRYTNFFATIKQLLEEGAIGRLISIQLNENVAYWHYAHSYVRGNWRNSSVAGPMILSKSCHDMDMLLWLAGADCTHISSFGSQTHFVPENAPAGAPDRCLDGCPAAHTCLYYAPRFYLTGEEGWPASVISDDVSMDALLKALQDGPYGRCVYHCDNNVVDHQVVNAEFANGVTASFTMCAYTNDVCRTIKLMGTEGEMSGIINRDKSEIEIFEFPSAAHKVINLQSEGGPQGHGGGDFGLMRHFVQLVQSGKRQPGLTSAAISVQSHLMAFAAEQSRLESRAIDMGDFARSQNWR